MERKRVERKTCQPQKQRRDKKQMEWEQHDLKEAEFFLIGDGGPSLGTDQELQDMLGGSNFSSNVKEKVKALLAKLLILPRYTSSHKPGFVYLLEGDPEGVISFTPHPLKV